MAYTKLPEPGTSFGPCNHECTHTDCAKTREMAAAYCVECEQPIGYETNFTHIDAGLIHVVCALPDKPAQS